MSKNNDTLWLSDYLNKLASFPLFYGTKLTDVNSSNPLGDRPLHFAARNDDVLAVEKLIKLGADVNAQGEEGNAPLHEALLAHSINSINILLRNGARIDVQNRWGETPAKLAQLKGIDITK